MRSVSFVDHLEFEFSGNILDGCLTLGDVDNDGNSEFVVANTAGDLAIFKGKDTEPWRQFHGLGMITCVVLGDICNVHQNILFCITSEGWCHLLWFGCDGHQECKDGTQVNGGFDVAIYHQSLPTNSKTALVADVDGDGEKELVIGSTDRAVRVFKWIKQEKKESEDVRSSDKSLVKQNSKEGKIQKQNSKEGKGLFKQAQSKADSKTSGNASTGYGSTNSEGPSEHPRLFDGKFVCVKKWKLSGQVESLSVVDGRNGTSPAILVSQPGGAYIYLVCAEESVKENLQKQTELLTLQDSVISFADCHFTTENSRSHYPLPPRNDMSSIPAQIVSWSCKPARSRSTPSNFIAVCTLNGTLAVIKDEKMHWSVNLNHNFFAVQKVDITGDGTDEVVFCAWDGETYIIDQYENIVNFKFGEAVSAFCSGTYAVNEDSSLPCLVYVTFHNRIRLYWDVKMRGLYSSNFSDAVVAKLNDFNLDPKFREFMESEDDSLDNEKIKQLTSWCLYGGGHIK